MRAEGWQNAAMSDSLVTLIIILLIFVGSLGIVIPTILLAKRQHRKVAEAWSAFALKHQFTIDTRTLHMHGQKEGWPIDLRVESRGGGKDQYVVTIIRWGLDGLLPRSFEMEPEGPGDKFRKLMGQKDDEIGEETFDNAFKITNLIPEVKEILRDDLVRQSLLLVASMYHRFYIHGGEMHVEYRGVPSRVDALESILDPVFASILAMNFATGGARPHRHTQTPPVVFQNVK